MKDNRELIRLRELILPHGEAHRYRQHQRLFYEGDEPQAVYCLLSGRVRLASTSAQGREFIFGEIRPNRIIGLTCSLASTPYPYTATAMEDGDILTIPASILNTLMETRADIAALLLRTLSLEHNIATRRLKSIVFHSVEERLENYLRKQFEHRRKHARTDTLELRFSREELSAMLGTTRESVSRALTALTRRGLIRVQGKMLQCADLDLFLPPQP